MSIRKHGIVTMLVLALGLCTAMHAQVVVEEYMPSSAGFDANLDGTANPAHDRFVEIRNAGAELVDISGWSLYWLDDFSVYQIHTFAPGTLMPPNGCIVIFQGGDVSAFNAQGWGLGIVPSFFLHMPTGTWSPGAGFHFYVPGVGFTGGPTPGSQSSYTGVSLQRQEAVWPAGWHYQPHTAYGPLVASPGRHHDGTPFLPPIMDAPAKLPGNGADLRSLYQINGSWMAGARSYSISTAAGGAFQMRYDSPNGGLHFQPLSIFYQLLPSSEVSLLQSKVLFGDPGPGGFWLDFDLNTGLPYLTSATPIVTLFDGIGLDGPPTFPAPALAPHNPGFAFSWTLPPSVIPAGNSLLFQTLAFDPSHPVGLAIDDAVEFIFVP